MSSIRRKQCLQSEKAEVVCASSDLGSTWPKH
jgi:hypothetical protein